MAKLSMTSWNGIILRDIWEPGKLKSARKYRHDNMYQLAGVSTMQKYVAAERFFASKEMPNFTFSNSFIKNCTEFMTGHRKKR